MSKLVSFYSNIKSVVQTEPKDINTILGGIKSGFYKDIVERVRTETDKAKRDELKKKAPNFTASGLFTKRTEEGLKDHSGYIAIDIDDVEEYETTFKLLCNDDYTYACFKSIGGSGLCVLIQINGTQHRDSFESLKAYFYNKYSIIIDPSCGNISRARFVSYDEDLFINEKAKKFKASRAAAKEHEAARTSFHIHTSSKFEKLLSLINTDICGDYERWYRIGAGIASEYGESGLDYYQAISRFGATYDPDAVAKQYRACLKSSNGTIKINTVYYWAKQHGYTVSLPDEERIAKQAYYAKRSGKAMPKAETEEQQQVIEAVYEQNYEPKPDPKQKGVNINDVSMWLTNAYEIRRNEITREYELNGNEMQEKHMNDIYLEAKTMFDKLNRELFDTIICSSRTPDYNPIRYYLDGLKYDGVDHLTDLAASITSDTGTPEWRKAMVTKWLLGMIETVYEGEPNILLLILAGEKNTGKTQFFKRLMPDTLRRFFANSQLDKGKDDEVLMTQKLMIFDDEYSGKSKQDSKHMKRMLSSDTFTLREPYGRKNVTLKRIATLCGTCNETEILNDATGNRRIIVIEATGQFNFDLYNSVDKDQLFAQLKEMYLAGQRAGLTSDEIAELEKYTATRYGETSIEAEMVIHLFEDPAYADKYDFKWTSLVKDHIETFSKQKISIRKLGLELKKLGYKYVGQNGRHGWLIKAKADRKPQNWSVNGNFEAPGNDGIAPF
jgi:predicted P-loop ATPase